MTNYYRKIMLGVCLYMQPCMYSHSSMIKANIRTDPKRILVCAPHPDDDIIGCGGTIIKHAIQGDIVTILYMTKGDAAKSLYSKKKLATIREQEARRAAHIIGVSTCCFFNNPDGKIKKNKKTIKETIALIRHVKPHIVYIPHKHDEHTDHQATHTIIKTALIKAYKLYSQEDAIKDIPWNIEKILCYEVWTPLQRVTHIENITQQMELKLTALRQHISQIEDVKYDDAIEGLNRYRGVMTKKGQYCECFKILNIKK